MRSAAWRPPGRCCWGCGGAGEEFLQGMEAVVPLTPARAPCPPHPAMKLPQGEGGPTGEVGGGLGGGLRARGPGAAAAGAGDGGRESVVWGARNAGSVVPVVPGGRRGQGKVAACVPASRRARVVGAGSWRVTAAPRGAGALKVGPGGGGRTLALRGAGEAGAGVLFGWGRGAKPFMGARFFAGQAGPLGGRRWYQGGIL